VDAEQVGRRRRPEAAPCCSPCLQPGKLGSQDLMRSRVSGGPFHGAAVWRQLLGQLLAPLPGPDLSPRCRRLCLLASKLSGSATKSNPCWRSLPAEALRRAPGEHGRSIARVSKAPLCRVGVQRFQPLTQSGPFRAGIERDLAACPVCVGGGRPSRVLVRLMPWTWVGPPTTSGSTPSSTCRFTSCTGTTPTW
jgi:hypothetical protein